jgi:hypothetical protein
MTLDSRASLTICLLAVACLAGYGLTGYFGIRSPDSEVVFRTARSLVEQGDFALEADGLPWKGFGTSRGVDGKVYSVFGPLQPLVAVPFVYLALRVASDGGGPGGVSHYVDGGLSAFVGGRPPQLPAEHRLRSWTTVFNVVVTTLLVLAFFFLTLRLTGSNVASLLSSVLFGFGTLVWPYSGTFFSEPLAMLFLVLSLLPLIGPGAGPRWWTMLLSGLSLGLAVSAHLSALLFVPFVGAYVLIGERPHGFRGLLRWATGLGVPLMLLAWHNTSRFGSMLETGRGVGEWHYADWVFPGTGLVGLLFSWGKGLVWLSPAIVLGLAFYRKLVRAAPLFALLMLGSVVFRLVFVASRSDWHGGFCLGPRYMLLALPLLLLPVGLAFRDQIAGRHFGSFVATATVTVVCVCQQLYFSLGEIFSFLHLGKLDVMVARRPEEALYFDFGFSPLVRLLDDRAGPLVLQGYEGSLYVLWSVLALLLAGGLCLLFVWLWRGGRTRPAVDGPE